MADCWICGTVADKWNLPQARLCGNCWTRGVDGLRALDFGIVHTKTTMLEIEAPPQHAPSIQLVFRAETFGSLVTKLVKRELQLGQQHIDDQVYFEYADESDLPYLKSYEVSELINELSRAGTIEVANAKALVQIQEQNVDIEQVTMLTASLLHFISARQTLSRG